MELTLEQAERKRQQAEAFMERLGKEGAADRFAEMTAAEYAESRGAELVENPNGDGRCPVTIAELEGVLDEVETVLDAAYTPEASRETLAEAVGTALDLVQGEDEDEEEEENPD